MARKKIFPCHIYPLVCILYLHIMLIFLTAWSYVWIKVMSELNSPCSHWSTLSWLYAHHYFLRSNWFFQLLFESHSSIPIPSCLKRTSSWHHLRLTSWMKFDSVYVLYNDGSLTGVACRVRDQASSSVKMSSIDSIIDDQSIRSDVKNPFKAAASKIWNCDGSGIPLSPSVFYISLTEWCMLIQCSYYNVDL